MHINEFQGEVERLMLAKGFKSQYEEVRKAAGQVQMSYMLGALLATEPAEYIDAVKKGLGKEAELEEAADTIFRALNIFVMNDASAEEYLLKKLEKNFNRPYMFGHGQ